MSEPTPIRTLLCFSMQPAFFDLPFSQIGGVWQATQALMAGVAKVPGATIIGTLDDDQTMVGMSNGMPATWYILADFPDRQAVIAACNLLRTIVGGYTPQQAIDAPALHTTSVPESFWPRTWTPGGAVVEERLGEDVIAELTRRGHVLTRAGGWALGRLSCVGRDPRTGVLHAASNPRGAQGYAAGR